MTRKQLRADLLSVYDDFVEFNDYCAFLCDALSALFGDLAERDMDTQSVQGVKHQCNELKDRSEQMRILLKQAYKQSLKQSKIINFTPRLK